MVRHKRPAVRQKRSVVRDQPSPGPTNDLQPEIRVGTSDAVAAGVLLAVILMVAFSNVIFDGRSLLYSDNYNPVDARFLPEHYGPGFVSPEVWQSKKLVVYPNQRDPGATWWQWEPALAFHAQSLADGELPFWDPYVAGGSPAMANLIPAFWFPPQLLVVMLGPSSGLLNFYFLSLVWSAGFFTDLVLRKHGLSTIASLVGAAAFMMSGAVIQTLGSFIGQALVCLPFVIYLTRRFADRPTSGRGVGLAVGYAVSALASFPPVLVEVFLIAGTYGVVMTLTRAAAPGGWNWRAAAAFAGYSLLALVFVAFYYIPAFVLIGSAPQVDDAYRNTGLQSWIWESLYQLTSPVLMGGVDVYQTQLMPGMQYYWIPYAGVATLWLATLADRRGQGRNGPLCAFATCAAILIALKLVGIAPVQWLGLLPGFSGLHVAVYFGVGLCWLLAILAAIGAENLTAGTVTRRRLLIATAGAVVAACSLLDIAQRTGAVALPAVNTWFVNYSVATGVLAIAVLLTWVGTWRAGRLLAGSTVGIVACLLVTSEGIRNAYYPRQVRNARVFERPPRFLRPSIARAPLMRSFALGVLPANTNSPFRVPTLDSLMASNPPRMFQLYKRYANPQADFFMRGATEVPPEPVLNAAAVGVLSVSANLPDLMAAVTARGHAVVDDDGFIRVLERKTEPRCYFTSDFIVTTREGALERIGEPRRPQQIVVESKPRGLEPVPNAAGDPAVAHLELRRNSVGLEVTAPRTGFVYCADSFFDGWSASVNGVPSPIQPANYAFRAVSVGPGRHKIRFSYWPPGLTAGLWISAAGLLAAGTVLGASRNWRRSPTDAS